MMSQQEKRGVIGGMPSKIAVQSEDDGKLPASSSSVSMTSFKSGSSRSKEGLQLQAARKLSKEVDDNLQVSPTCLCPQMVSLSQSYVCRSTAYRES